MSLQTSGHQHSDKVCGICTATMGVGLWIKMCNTGDIVYKNHILAHISLNIASIEIPYTLLEWWWPACSHVIEFNTLANVLCCANPVYKYTHVGN